MRAVRAAQPSLLTVCAMGTLFMVVVALAVHGPQPAEWLYALSWQAIDKPWMPDRLAPVPVLGLHFFGDWQTFLGWSQSSHPYIGHRINLNALPALAWLLRPFLALPLQVSVAVLVVASLTTTYVAVRLLAPQWSWGRVTAAWAVFIAFSHGMIFTIDRGAMQALVIAAVGIWLWALSQRRDTLGAVLLALAIVAKPYIALLLMFPVQQRRWRTVIATVLIVGVSSVIGFAMQPGPFWESVAGYRKGSAHFATHNPHADGLALHAPSLIGVLLQPVLWVGGEDAARAWVASLPTWALSAPGALWVLLVAYLLFRNRLSAAVTTCFLLSVSQLFLSSAGGYTVVWAGLGAVILVQAPPVPRERWVRRMLEIALVVSIVPIPVSRAGTFDAPLVSLLSPVAWLVVGVLAVVSSARVHSTPTSDNSARKEVEAVGTDVRAFIAPARGTVMTWVTR